MIYENTCYKHSDKYKDICINFFKICCFLFILANYSLLSLNVHAARHCSVCGVGKYTKVMYDMSRGLPIDEEFKYLLRCSDCAHLLYISDMYDEMNTLTMECKYCRLVYVARACACAICASGSCALGAYICTLGSSSIGFFSGCFHFASSLVCGLYPCCSGKIECNTIDDVKNKIGVINLKIMDSLCVQKEPRARINHLYYSSGEIKDKIVDNTFFNNLVIKKIEDCYNNMSDKNDIQCLDKELVMILALYEIWNNNCHDNEMSISNRSDIWIQLNKEKEWAKHLRFSCNLLNLEDESIIMMLLFSKNINNTIFDKLKDNFVKSVSCKRGKVLGIIKEGLLENDVVRGRGDEMFHDIELYYSLIKSGSCADKILLIKNFLCEYFEERGGLNSFIISVTFNNMASIQMLFYKVDGGWNLYYPELLGDEINFLSDNSIISLFDFLYEKNNELCYKDIMIVMPRILPMNLTE